MKINFTYDPGTTLEQILVFETAGKLWSQYLQDDVTVNLQVGVTHANNLPRGVIGGALPGMSANVDYRTFKTQYEQDISSSDDAIANSNLGSFSAWVGSSHVTANGNGQISGTSTTRTLNMTRANAKALELGLGLNNSQGLDGYILMSDLSGQGVSWDYDVTRSGAPAAGKLDFLSTALHEIGHALGFVSGIDQPGWVAAVVDDFTQLSAAYSTSRSRAGYINPIDLFRYSATSHGKADIGYGSALGEKYFSIDGGHTSLANFSSGSDTAAGGDGYQASHWKNQSNALGIMDPTLGRGERANISALDLRAFDVMGWDIHRQGVNRGINLAALRDQALQDVASRLNKSVSWVNNNKTSAANQLAQVRVMEIAQMAENSEVYDLSWLNPGGGNSYWLNWGNPNAGNGYWMNWWNQGGGQGWWQTMEQLFQQRGLFSVVDLDALAAEADSADVDPLTGLALDGANVAPAMPNPGGGQPVMTSRSPDHSFGEGFDVMTFSTIADPAQQRSAGSGPAQGQPMLTLGAASEQANGLAGALAGLAGDPLLGGAIAALDWTTAGHSSSFIS